MEKENYSNKSAMHLCLLILMTFLFTVTTGESTAQTTATINCDGSFGTYSSGYVNSSGSKNAGNMQVTTSSERRGWAHFDLTSIPAGAIVNSVTIQFQTFSSTVSSAGNFISGFTGDPNSMSGTSIYAECYTGSGNSFNTSSWTANGSNSKSFNAAGISFIQANLGTNNVNIGFKRGSTNLYNIYGYPGTTSQEPKLIINYTVLSPCTGTPTPGNTLASNNGICAGTSVNLSLQNSTSGSGISYQWQSSSSSGGPWTTFGSNSSTQSVTPSVDTWYRCEVSCGANTGISNPVQVTLNNFYNCYCASGATLTADTKIARVILGSLNNPSPSSCQNYTDYTGLTPPILLQGASYPGSVQHGTCGGFYGGYSKMFIDFNQDGDFLDAGEQVLAGNHPSSGSFVNGTVSIPVSAMTGITGMRVVLREGSSSTQGPCGTFTWGETEDYLVNITAANNCSGTPNPGNTLSDANPVCSTQSFTLTLSNLPATVGNTFQWQSSPNGTSWSNIGGANSSSLTISQASATYYQCIVSCAFGASATSNPILVNQTLCYCASAASSTVDEEIYNVTLGALNNTSNCSVVAPGAGSILSRYSNFVGFATIPDLTQSQSHPVNITLGQCNGGTYTDYVSVFIDFNQDGDFDDTGELAYVSGAVSASPSGAVVNGTISVPGCATVGNTRMRVIMSYSSPVTSACGSYTWGETEDYLVNIVSGPVTPAVASTASGASTLSCNIPGVYTLASGYSGAINWQLSTASASGPFNDIAGATASNLTYDASTSGTGTYHFRARFTGVGCTPDVFSNVVSTVYGAPVVDISSTVSGVLCRGNDITLSTTSTGPYSWSNGSSSASITASPLTSTTYTLAAGPSTCQGTASYTVNVSGPVAAASTSAVSLSCPGGPVNLFANLIGGSPGSATASGGFVTINSFGNANPYPSIATVSGLSQPSSVVSVTITNLQHTWGSDVDIALRAPNGQSIILFADKGNSSSFDAAKTYTFQDGFPAFNAGPSGTYSIGVGGTYSGASLAPYLSSLAGFNGNMNGDWKLYVYDDAGGDAGTIQSWSIQFASAPVPFNTNGPVTYSWSGTDGFTSSLENPVAIPPSTTTYTLTVADNTCSSSSQVIVQTLPAPSVSSFNGSPVCEGGSVQFFTFSNGAPATVGNPGTLNINVTGTGFLDETSWQVKNSSNVIIGSGGPYGFGTNNNANVTPTASDYPVTFVIETQGTFNDNSATYSVTCSTSGSTMVSGSISGGNVFTSGSLSFCGTPGGPAPSFSWTGPNGFTSSLENPLLSNASVLQTGFYTVTYSDGNGCTASFDDYVTINANPVVDYVNVIDESCPGYGDGYIEIGISSGDFSYFTTDIFGSLFSFDSPASFFGVTPNTYSFIITDGQNCTTTTNAIVGTVPNVPPTLICPSDYNVNTTPGVCGAILNYSDPVASDICPVGLGAVSLTSGIINGGTFPLGTTINSFYVEDAQGASATCTFNVTVTDLEPPVALCQNVTVMLDANGNGSTTAAAVDNGSNDACGIQSLALSQTSFTCANVGPNAVVLTVTDNNGNVSTCNATVTVVDNVPPVALCQNVTIYLDANGNASTTAAAVDNGSNDACGIQSLVLSQTNFDCSMTGANGVVLTVTDNNGNVSTCNATVTVLDTIAPVIVCANSFNVGNDAGVCGATINYNVTSSDNCPNEVILQTAGLPSGSVFPVGTTINSFIVTDASGNTATCSFTVTVTDTEFPVITNVPSNFSSCNPISWTAPTITDNCPGVQVTSTHTPGTNFPSGTTTVTYTATDAYNHVTTASFDVTVLEPSTAADNITSNRDYNNICLGENITLTLNGGILGEAASWKWYSGSCGGTAAGTGTSITVAPTVTTTYYVRAEGLCNITSCVQITVVVSTGPPASAPVYSQFPAYGAPGITDTIKVNPVLGATYYYWFTNNGQINGVLFNGGISPQQTAAPEVGITFVLSQSNYQIRVRAGNACGISGQTNNHIRGTVEAPTSLTGPTLVCPGDVASYTVSAVAGTNVSYNWQLIPASAGTISGTGLTRTVTFAAGFTSAQLCVNGVSNFGLAGAAYCIQISTNAPAPGLVSGNANPCEGSTNTYSTTAVTGATGYSWSTTVPGAVITGSGLTASVTFPSGAFAGDVCVQAVTACGLSTPSCLSVTSGAPGVAGPISGPVLGICGASNVNYSLGTSDANSYGWILPTGVTVSGAGNLNAVNLNFGAGFTSGTIAVVAYYDCGTDTSYLFVSGEPVAPTVTPATICAGTDQLYFASSTGATSYNWSITGDDYSECTDAPTCSNYYIIWGVSGGSFSVTASNACGTSAPFNLATNCRISESGAMETKVFPNPTTGKFMVEFTSYAGGNHEMTITDLSGRVVLTEQVKARSGMNQHELDLGFANKGVYMLYVKNANGSISVNKIVIE